MHVRGIETKITFLAAQELVFYEPVKAERYGFLVQCLVKEDEKLRKDFRGIYMLSSLWAIAEIC